MRPRSRRPRSRRCWPAWSPRSRFPSRRPTSWAATPGCGRWWPARRRARPTSRPRPRWSGAPRRPALVEDPETGVLAVVGGKLTTYRRMAQDAVDRIAARPGVAAGPCRTSRLPLVGAGATPSGVTPRPRRTNEMPAADGASAPELLMRRYGTEARDVAALAEGDKGLLEPVAPGVP